ncbi:hypothetical protein LCGC14_0325740 [marine sediment metagenome]|uniref:Uncharacterized protein n=1 Tax=marine sediment metagenome TaxID=412755 RepID=A0A0F9WPY7_9ZZZZ
MTLATDIASDLATMDGIETVTLYDASADTTDTSVTALRRALSHREVQLGFPAGIEARDVAFHLQANTTAIVPVAGDTITDSGSVVFTILSVSKDTLGTRWRCLCRQEK